MGGTALPFEHWARPLLSIRKAHVMRSTTVASVTDGPARAMASERPRRGS